MDKKLLIIDADSLVYQSSKEELLNSIGILEEKVTNIFLKTKATHYIMFLSPKKTFRHDVDSLYKANRKKTVNPLKWLKTLRAYLVENYGAIQVDNVEADDLCAYWTTKFTLFPKIILASPDKDLLGYVVGNNFNYTYKLADREDESSLEEGRWVITTKENSIINFWKSMVTGDTTDNIKGIEGRGVAYFNKVFKDRIEPINYPLIVLDMYIEKYGESNGIYQYQKNYRLLHLLSNGEDFINEIGKLPPLPTIREVPNNTPIIF